MLYSLPILWLFTIYEGIPQIDDRIILVYILGPPLELLAMILYMKSLRISPLSLTVPFQSFTPAFLLLTSYLMLRETPGLYGVGGVLVIVAGAYTLNLSSSKEGFLTPFKMIYKEKGSFLMLIVAFIFSLTANFGKMGVVYSSPIFFGATYFSIITIFLLPIVLYKNNNIRNLFRKEFVLIGMTSSFMVAFHVLAVKLIYVSYMISIKRSSILFSIIAGAFLLKEKNIKEKLIGGILMIIGIIIITLLG